MTWSALFLALLALLVTPGPTNTLLFVAGAVRGWRGALAMIPAELAGYLVVVLPLALLGAHLLEALPLARPLISVLAGLWIGVLAVRLWRQAVQAGHAGVVMARGVLVTTMLNPKALIFGLVLLPAAPVLAPAIAMFAGLVAVVATGWAGAGALAAGSGKAPSRRVLWVRRASALWLAVLSVGLVARGLAS